MNDPKYHYPAVTADAFVFSLEETDLCVLLVKRKNPPFQGQWAIPGGFMEEEEPAETCAERELSEETGLSGIRMYQAGAFSAPGRDPRGRTISIGFTAVLRGKHPEVRGADDAAEAAWFPLNALPNLAFDHNQCLETVLTFLRERIRLGDPARRFPSGFPPDILFRDNH